MPNPGHKQADLDEAVRLVEAHGNIGLAARATGMSYSTLERRYKAAARQPIDPAMQAAMRAVGTDMTPAMAWLKTAPDADGNSFSVMLKPSQEDAEDRLARMVEVLADLPPAPRVAPPEHVIKGHVGLYVVSDLHYGATCTKDEAGLEYSREIAQERARTGFAQCNAAMPPCEVAVVLYNGDTTHSNDNKHRTPKSGHPLRVEGSHQSNIFAIEVIIAWQADAALEKHERVYLVIKPGNHDPDTPCGLIMAMRARYRDNPRVIVVDDENPYFVFQMGRLFFCSHHGDGASPVKRALSIPHKFRREWGVADFHFFFTGDKHHSKSDTFGGLHWRQVPSMISLEQHSQGEGYADTSGMVAAWFDTETGRMSETEIRF